MSTDAQRGTSTWTRVRAGLSLGMVLGLGTVGTMAAWSDSATAESGTFSTGLVELKVDDQSPVRQFVELRRSSMLRGESVAGALTVQNTGTVDFNWAVAAAATGSSDLINVLRVGLFATGANNGQTCSGAQIGSTQPLASAPTLATGRPLAAGGSEPVCVQVTVDPSAGADARFKIANPVFTFVGEGL